MTKEQAIEAMKSGQRVTHQYFTDNEWVESDKEGLVYIFEDTVKCHAVDFWNYRYQSFWNDGWSIHESTKH